jgi:hypothetical protein
MKETKILNFMTRGNTNTAVSNICTADEVAAVSIKLNTILQRELCLSTI